MSIAWLLPAAFAGLALLGVPIAIHLLVRQQSRRLPFPSLRFLQPSHMAALKRRAIQDAWLLTCRILIVAMAVTALAAPAVDTASRQAAHATRVARALVIDQDRDAQTLAGEAAGAFAFATFSRARLSDAMSDAVRWLDAQPPSARELVIGAAFRRDQLHSTDFDIVPAETGIRLIALDGPEPSRGAVFPVLVMRDGRLIRLRRRARLDDASTTIVDGAPAPVTAVPIQIVAAAADQPFADATLRAVLEAGIMWPDPGRRLLLVWPGTPEAAVQQRSAGGRAVVRLPAYAPPSTAASAVARAVADAVGSANDTWEPSRISAEELSRWSRRPGPPRAGGPPVDEGDRRWAWGLVLLLLGAEVLMRQSEARVA